MLPHLGAANSNKRVQFIPIASLRQERPCKKSPLSGFTIPLPPAAGAVFCSETGVKQARSHEGIGPASGFPAAINESRRKSRSISVKCFQPQLLPNGIPQCRHLRVVPKELQLLLCHSITFRLASQNKNRKGIGDVFMEIVGSVPADIMSGVHLIIADSRIAQILPKRLIKCIAERSLHKTGRIVGAISLRQIHLCFIFQQNMAIFVENRIGQLAPIPAGAVFIVYIIVINADAEAGVIRNAIFLHGRCISQNITVSVAEQIELCNF